MSKTKVVNVKKKDFDVYVGRAVPTYYDARIQAGSEFANPFSINDRVTRDQAIEQYREHIISKLKKNPKLRNRLMQMEGKKLGCWCSPRRCHGDVLVELIEENVKKRDDEVL